VFTGRPRPRCTRPVGFQPGRVSLPGRTPLSESDLRPYDTLLATLMLLRQAGKHALRRPLNREEWLV